MKNTFFFALAFLIISTHLKAQTMNIQTDPTAKCYSTAEITIKASKQHVYEILAGINKWLNGKAVSQKQN